MPSNFALLLSEADSAVNKRPAEARRIFPQRDPVLRPFPILSNSFGNAGDHLSDRLFRHGSNGFVHARYHLYSLAENLSAVIASPKRSIAYQPRRQTAQRSHAYESPVSTVSTLPSTTVCSSFCKSPKRRATDFPRALCTSKRERSGVSKVLNRTAADLCPKRPFARVSTTPVRPSILFCSRIFNSLVASDYMNLARSVALFHVRDFSALGWHPNPSTRFSSTACRGLRTSPFAMSRSQAVQRKAPRHGRTSFSCRMPPLQRSGL